MPALNVTAIDHNTGRLTVPAHGLNTGDGPGALFPTPGSAGVIPTGLAPITDYFAIVVDPSTIQLADSNAHAMAGSALSFADNGTLPLQLGVGLPYRRPRTYVPSSAGVPGSQIKSADLNAGFDSWIALWNLLTGQAQALWAKVVIAVAVTFNALVTFGAGAAAAVNQHITVSGTGKFKHGTRTLIVPHSGPTFGAGVGPLNAPVDATVTGVGSGGNNAVIIIPLHVGVRVLAVRAQVLDSLTGPTAIRIAFQAVNDGSVGATHTALSNSTGTAQTLTISPLNITVLSGAVYYIVASNSTPGAAGTTRITQLEVDYDQP